MPVPTRRPVAPSMPAVVVLAQRKSAQLTNQRHDEALTKESTFKNWLEARFGSASADIGYGTNWARVRNPAIDSLTESVARARVADDTHAVTRALDPVLLWNFYFIPGPSTPGMRETGGNGCTGTLCEESTARRGCAGSR